MAQRAAVNGSGKDRMSGVDKDKLVALALAKIPPTSLRLGLLELAGWSTSKALDALGVSRSHRYRASRICGSARAADGGPAEDPRILEVPARHQALSAELSSSGISGKGAQPAVSSAPSAGPCST